MKNSEGGLETGAHFREEMCDSTSLLSRDPREFEFSFAVSVHLDWYPSKRLSRQCKHANVNK